MLGFSLSKFLFTIFNFFILLWILKRFLFRPTVNVLEERKEKIHHSMEQVEQAKKQIEQAEEEREQIIAEAAEEAEKIRRAAEEGREEILASARAEAEKIIAESKASIEREKEEVRKDMQLRLIILVSMAARKILDHGVTEEERRAVVESAVKKTLEEIVV